MKEVTVEQARQSLSDLVDAAAHGEDIILISTRGLAVRLVPTAPLTQATPLFGSARGLINMADDFDAPLTDFDEYTK